MKDHQDMEWRLRYRYMGGFYLLALMLVGMLLRLGWLSIIKADELSDQALAQRSTLLPVTSTYPEILDRYHLPLVSYQRQIYPTVIGVESHSVLSTSLARVTGFSLAQLEQQMVEISPTIWQWSRSVTEEQWQQLRQQNLPGLMPVIKEEPSHYLAVHLTGTMESGLRGFAGNNINTSVRSRQALAIVTDSEHRPLWGLIRPVVTPMDAAPRDLITTINGEVQTIVEEVIANINRGAVVVMDPKSGDILAMASQPTYHPQQIAQIINDNPSDAPLINRALSFYPPGSVYKLLVAGAALEADIVSGDDQFYCPGYVDVGEVRIHCHGIHGWLNIQEAIADSCNAAFVEIGLELGYSRWLQFTDALGVGARRNLSVVEDKAQLYLPFPQPIYHGDLANLSIGQGNLLASPLDMAVLYSALANEGVYHPPRLVQGWLALNGSIVRHRQETQPQRLWSPEVNQLLLDALLMTVESGTGLPAFSRHISIAGKSGTAETGTLGINHAWFAAIAPYDNPQLVVVVFVEEGQRGGQVAGPIAREIIEKILLPSAE